MHGQGLRWRGVALWLVMALFYPFALKWWSHWLMKYSTWLKRDIPFYFPFYFSVLIFDRAMFFCFPHPLSSPFLWPTNFPLSFLLMCTPVFFSFVIWLLFLIILFKLLPLVQKFPNNSGMVFWILFNFTYFFIWFLIFFIFVLIFIFKYVYLT